MNNTQEYIITTEFTIESFVQLQAECKQKQEEIDRLTAELAYVKNELAQLKRMIFGAKSERFISEKDSGQLLLGLCLPEPMAEPVKTETITYERKEKTEKTKIIPTRQALPAHLPRHEEIIEPIEIPEGSKKIGEEITETLECKPATLFVRKMVRPKYMLQTEDGRESRIIIADLPSLPIPKSIAGASFIAHVTISKYVDHLPLYRQAKQLKRQGVDMPLSTLGGIVAKGADSSIPLYETLTDKTLNGEYLQVDETPIPVLTEDKPGAAHKGYLWVYRSVLENLVLFKYEKSRAREGPKELLKDFKGTLQTDGYSAYDIFDKPGEITLLGCMAHARRKFEAALTNDKVRAEYVMAQIQQLYMIERYARENNYSFDERKVLREKEALPILAELSDWMKFNYPQVMPRSAIGNALAYSLNFWNRITGYVFDGRYEIDNNAIERCIRPVALGRKNYLFAGSHEAAQRTAMIYSFMGTCIMNNVEPFAWLKDVLTRLPDHKANKLEELLPNNWQPLRPSLL